MRKLFTPLCAAAVALMLIPSGVGATDSQWAAVAQALGKSGTEMPGGIYRVGMPRTDLKVTLDGVALKPGFALGSWVAFDPMGHEAMVMGDLVLTQDEIEPVMKKLQEGGVEITALHNHLLRAAPLPFYMHIMGHGDPVTVAHAIHEALILSKTPLGNPPPAAAEPKIDLDTAMLDHTLGANGKSAGGVYQFSIRRANEIREQGMPVPAPMGTAESINFQPTGNGKAAITGDFVLTASEVSPVMRTLRDNGIDVTALHNHMLDDQPRMFFVHFWANDDAAKLAKGLKAALNKVNIKQEVANR